MIEQWHRMVHDRDLSALDKVLADNVVLHSPVVHRAIEGKSMVSYYLQAAFHTLLNDKFTYVREVVSGRHAVLEFTTEIDGILINGVDMLTFDDDGDIVEFKVMVRPLKAVNMVHEKMGAMLAMASNKAGN